MNSELPILNDIREYLKFISQVKNLSQNTKKSYERDLKKLSSFLNRLNISCYSEINEEICSAWIGDLYALNNNPKSIQRHLSSAKGFFKFLKKNNVISSSPFELVTAPRSSSILPEVLSPEDVEQLLNFKPSNNLEVRDVALVELMYSTGLRVSEAVNIILVILKRIRHFYVFWEKDQKPDLFPWEDSQ